MKGGFFSIDRGRSFSARGTDGSRARFRESLGWWRAHGPEPNTLFQRFLKNIRSQCSQKKLLAR